MKNLQAIDIVYNKAPDSQKVWIEATNRYWLKGGLRSLKNSLENHVGLSKSLAESILNQLPKKPKTVVDIGTGYGGVAINLALSDIKVIAVEPGEIERGVIKYFLNKYPQAKRNLRIANGFAEKLPVSSNIADLCILSQVLEHVNDPKKTIAGIARILKPKGYLHLSCPNYIFPAEQHYKLPYLPLMSKKLFAAWALFLLKTLNIRNIENPKNRDFSMVGSFIESVNYTTDSMIKKLCRENDLEIIWSSRQATKEIVLQIKRHWNQNPSPITLLAIVLSFPIKLARSALALLGVLPMKLEYLIRKSS